MAITVNYSGFSDEELDALYYEIAEEKERRRRAAEIPLQIEALVTEAVVTGVDVQQVEDAVERGKQNGNENGNNENDNDKSDRS